MIIRDNFFLILHNNICCDPSSEPSCRDDSDKGSQHMVSLRNKNKRAMMALGRSPEYHWDQIISKSVHRFSRRSCLKLFSIYSPGGHFVQQSGTV